MAGPIVPGCGGCSGVICGGVKQRSGPMRTCSVAPLGQPAGFVSAAVETKQRNDPFATPAPEFANPVAVPDGQPTPLPGGHGRGAPGAPGGTSDTTAGLTQRSLPSVRRV